MKKKYTYILWDFNGTLFDDVEASIKSVNMLLRERGLPEIESVEAYHKVFGFPIIDYYRRLGFDFENESYDAMAKVWVKDYLENSKSSGLTDGVRELLDLFTARGIPQTVISATELGMLTNQIKELGIAGYFRELYGLDNIKAGSKEAIARSWRAGHPDAKALFIGDTEHDYDVATAIGADCVLVACGHQNRATLEKCGCSVVDRLSEIPGLIFGTEDSK